MDRKNDRASRQKRIGRTAATAILAGALLWPGVAAAEVPPAAFLFSLSNFTGTLPLEWVSLTIDPKTREVYVGDAGSRSVVIFNEQGMEVFRFGDDDRFGQIADLAVAADGSILILSRSVGDGATTLLHCDYRGEIVRRTALPARHGDIPFAPSRLARHGDRLYLADLAEMLVAETDLDGRPVQMRDVGAALGLSRREVANSGLGGFGVDGEGNLLFTLPAQFTAHRLGQDGQLASFGQPGSAPGRFGVAAGIAADADGRLYVVDTLRCVVLVFDRELKFVTEFGTRDTAPGGLIAPKELSVANDGKVYVTQRGKRGVNVYRLTPG